MKHRFVSAALLPLVLFFSNFMWGAATESVLYTFTSGADGGNPYAGPILDSKGNLYGTTVYGGAYNYGLLFEITP